MRLLIKSLFIIAFVISLASCGSTKITWNQVSKDAKNKETPCFIEYFDGRVEKFNKITSAYTMAGSGLLVPTSNLVLKIDGKYTTFNKKEVKAFQEVNGYSVQVKRSAAELNLSKFKDEEMDYAVRVCNGKIELFRRALQVESFGTRTVHEFMYVRKGVESPFQLVDKALIESMVADNNDIAKNFENLYNKGRAEQLVKLINAYNNN
jgi:hypothetical protein